MTTTSDNEDNDNDNNGIELVELLPDTYGRSKSNNDEEFSQQKKRPTKTENRQREIEMLESLTVDRHSDEQIVNFSV